METRRETQALAAPISIYEVHLGSWRRKNGVEFLTYDELGDTLIPYVDRPGLHPPRAACRSPSFPSTARGATSRSASSRRPAASGRRRLSPASSTAAMRPGLGVIIDWVPAHFPTDAHGLARFDGTALYEHDDPRLGFHRDWNTLIYNFGRTEVRNFLVANALYWLDRFHIDALRVDAVASMLYLDYSREAGRVDPQRPWRAREPRGHRLHPRAEHAAPSATIPAPPPSPRNRPPGRRCRGRSTAAAWASATSGTWAGCTTRSNTCITSRCTGNTITTR